MPMNVNELIEKARTQNLNPDNFMEYIKSNGGIEKLKRREFEKIMYAIPDVLVSKSYLSIYKMITDNESARLIKWWTWIAGIAAVANAIAAFIALK